jgi:tetratricopeptide (TPR) repeat protein
MTTPRPDRLTQAVLARDEGRLDEARAILADLHRANPDDASINLQVAWIHDRLGLESKAVPYYERALEVGLEGDDLQHALLGLGSTYRSLGRYRDSVRILDRGVEEFPSDPAMKIFQAMAWYNTGRAKEACELLLTIMATTDQPESIARYRSAIAEYARDLDRTWQ